MFYKIIFSKLNINKNILTSFLLFNYKIKELKIKLKKNLNIKINIKIKKNLVYIFFDFIKKTILKLYNNYIIKNIEELKN